VVRARRAPEAAEERYRRLFAQNPAAVFRTDLDGRLLECNEPFRTLLGVNEQEIARRNVLELLFGAAEASSLLERLAASGKVEGLEMGVRRNDGPSRWALGNLCVLDAPEGGQPEIAGTFLDVTQRRQARSEAVLLQMVTRALAEADDLPTALARVMDLFCRATGWALGQAWVPGSDGQELRWAAAYDGGDPRLEEFRHRSETTTLPSGKGIPGGAWASRRAEWVHDVTVSGWSVLTPSARRAGLKSGIAVPVLAGDTLVAVMEFYVFEQQPEDGRLLGLVETIATQLGWLIQRRRAEEERKEHLRRESEIRERLEALSRRLVEVQETERREIGRELHDHVGQLLTGVKLLLESSRYRPLDDARREEMQELVNEVLERVRDLSMSLRPSMLDDLGLVPALVWHVEHYSRQTGVEVDLRHSGLDRRFPTQVETAAFRIVQEALTNVARHSGAGRASAVLTADAGILQLEVSDRGRGFDPAASTARASSGLSGMRERARLLGGRLDIDSRPGEGTRIAADLPVEQGKRRE
jgi:PAS domain S-box-containing protein